MPNLPSFQLLRIAFSKQLWKQDCVLSWDSISLISHWQHVFSYYILSRWLEACLYLSGRHYYSWAKVSITPIPGNYSLPNLPSFQLQRVTFPKQVWKQGCVGPWHMITLKCLRERNFLSWVGSRWLETSLFVSGNHYYSWVKLCIRPIPGNNLVPNLPFPSS